LKGAKKIRLEGIQFLEGVKVIFGGTLKAKSELAKENQAFKGSTLTTPRWL
jgi:hypothetical protein